MKRGRPSTSKEGCQDDNPANKKPKFLSGKVKKGSFEHRFERRRYLKQLVEEFETATTPIDAKQEVLANLANFAYDSYNYHFFQEIGVIPVFLAELSVRRNDKLMEFAMAGICNCAGDKRIHREIVRKDGVAIVKQHVYSSASVEMILSSITALISLITVDNSLKDAILNDNFYDRLNYLSEHEDKRVRNVVQILMEDLRG